MPRVEIGQAVAFTDERGRRRDALVTAVHGPREYEEAGPSINVIAVCEDDDRADQYGRQVERSSSVVHRAHQGAHGMYWAQPEDG